MCGSISQSGEMLSRPSRIENGVARFMQAVEETSVNFSTQRDKLSYRRYQPWQAEYGEFSLYYNAITHDWTGELTIEVGEHRFYRYAYAEDRRVLLEDLKRQLIVWMKEKGIEYEATAPGGGG